MCYYELAIIVNLPITSYNFISFYFKCFQAILLGDKFIIITSIKLNYFLFFFVSLFCFKVCTSFDCVDHNKLWKILKEMGIPDHLICLLRNLYAGQETTVRTGHGKTDWFQIGKGVRQGCVLSPCLFNLYAEYIMRNAGLEETQAGIKIAGRNINNLRYTDDTTLMAESEEELKSFLMKVKVESEKVGLKLNIQKTKIVAFSPITSWQVDGESGNSDRLNFGGLQNHYRW